MNPRIFRMVVAFLGGFILLSLLPVLPGVISGFRSLPPLPPLAIDQMGDILLGSTALLCGVLLLISLRRRKKVAGREAGFARVLAQQSNRHAMVQPAARMCYQAPGQKPAPAAAAARSDSELQARIRMGAKKGERAPALARRHSLSVDAIRLAIGTPLPAPAVRRGSSFRTRQPSLPVPQPAGTLVTRRTAYGALA